MTHTRLGAIAVGLLSAALTVTSVPAQTVTVGVTNTNNCIPFNCPSVGGLVYQQVYAASAFAGLGGPVFISGLTFFRYEATALGRFSPDVFTFSFSTTAAAVNLLSGNPSDNVGSNSALFGTFSPGDVLIPAQFTITGTPFYYDPSAGNLLMNIQLNGLDNGSVLGFLKADNGSGLTSRSVGGFVDDLGLVTQFSYSPTDSVVPEPATLTLLATGLVGMVGAGMRRRRKA